jgi:glycosyltransferase involved in cell wall biosynthesis
MTGVVIVPARNEAATVGRIVCSVREATGAPVVVVASDCSDDTAMRAWEEGAAVVKVPRPGKGRAIRAGWEYARGMGATSAAFLDADLTNPPGERTADFLSIAGAGNFGKGHYSEPGRTHAAVAGALEYLHPYLMVASRQPLTGEWSAPGEVLDAVPWDLPGVAGYGIDLAALKTGLRLGRVVEVGCGPRAHRPHLDVTPAVIDVLLTAAALKEYPWHE